MEIVVILNNIRSNENVGSIFRTADATGVSKIILCGYTPAPVDRFGRENKGLTKASLGAEKSIEWEKVENINLIIERLKIEKFKIIGIEQDKNAIDYRKIKTQILESGIQNLAIVFGNEVDGLSKQDLELCDVIAELPMLGNKESLNVSVCAGVVLYKLLK
ncbi:MAG: TrmH family RNA methyltransferase [Patescibacteria group bacterium]